MGRVATVKKSDRSKVGEAQVLDVIIDPGGGALVTAPHFGAPGDDAKPLAGDKAVTVKSQGSGKEVVVGYLDEANEGISKNGERRIYARDSDGVIVADVHCKAGGNTTINAGTVSVVRFDQLQTAFDQLKSDFDTLVTKYNTHIHVTTATIGVGPAVGVISPTVSTGSPTSADIAPAESETVKVP